MKKEHIYCMGIGGIGVSALARYYLQTGHTVTGSDIAESEITKELQKLGATILIGPSKANRVPKDITKAIYSPAVKPTNLERTQATSLQVPVQSYPEALGELSKGKFTIAVSGTHGKSTTTSMLGIVLTKAGLDPTVIVGTKVQEFGNSNCRVGKSKYLVIEADEYAASFLNYWPNIIVLTNIEADHLDFYKNLAEILKTFKQYISHLAKDGVLVVYKKDKNIQTILPKKALVEQYSLEQKEAAMVRKVMQVPGEHYVSNALAVLTVARLLNIPDKTTLQALSAYKGAWRRFEIFPAFVKTTAGKHLAYTLVSDYGHHPTEVQATIQGARAKWPTSAKASAGKPKKKLWLVFQPHQYNRTYKLFNEFVNVLAKLPVDKLILTHIYDVPGREDPKSKKKVSAEMLVQAIQKKNKKLNILLIPEFADIAKHLQENIRGGEIVIVMGAGNIYNLTVELTQRLKKKKIQ